MLLWIDSHWSFANTTVTYKMINMINIQDPSVSSNIADMPKSPRRLRIEACFWGMYYLEYTRQQHITLLHYYISMRAKWKQKTMRGIKATRDNEKFKIFEVTLLFGTNCTWRVIRHIIMFQIWNYNAFNFFCYSFRIRKSHS